jgi:DNA-binding NarL/FixJ family response regulator
VPAKVLICDELPLVRQGLSTLLDAVPDVDVTASTDNPQDVPMLARTHRPDVMLVGFADDSVSGLELVRRIATDPHFGDEPPRAVVFHARFTDDSVAALLKAGAKGLLSREATSDEVLATIRTVARGRTALDTGIVDRMAEWFRERGARASSLSHPGIDTLTGREREVLQLIGRGMTIDEIAAELFIGISTVRTHLHRLRHKLDVKDRAQLVVLAYRTGLVHEAA